MTRVSCNWTWAGRNCKKYMPTTDGYYNCSRWILLSNVNHKTKSSLATVFLGLKTPLVVPRWVHAFQRWVDSPFVVLIITRCYTSIVLSFTSVNNIRSLARLLLIHRPTPMMTTTTRWQTKGCWGASKEIKLKKLLCKLLSFVRALVPLTHSSLGHQRMRV